MPQKISQFISLRTYMQMTPLLFFLKISKVYWEKNIGNNKATIGTLTILEVKF